MSDAMFFEYLSLGTTFIQMLLFVILNKSLKKTIYNYKNVILIATMIFVFCLSTNITINGLYCIKNNITVTLSSIYNISLNFPRLFSKGSMIFLAIISIFLTISNISLIKHEGFALSRLLGLLMGLSIIVSTLCLYFVDDLIFTQNIIENRVLFCYLRYLILAFLLILCYFECIYVATMIVSLLAVYQKPQYDKDFIIILGCAINKKGGLLPLLKGRVNTAVKYAWRQEIECGKPMKYICSGGQGPDEVISEASAMELYLISHFAENNEVYTEKQSKTTKENIIYSKEIVNQLMPNAKVAFATTNFHMFRSGLYATEAGFKNIEGIASKTKWYFWPNGFIREFIALLVMYKNYHIYISLFIIALAMIVSTTTILFV